MSEEEQAEHLYAIRGGKGAVGPIQNRKIKITCRKCGNDEAFWGIARVEPTIEIRLQDDGSYDVIDIEYWQEEDVDEIPLSCMVCQSTKLDITSIDDEDPAEKQEEDEMIVLYQDERITVRTKRSSSWDIPPF